MKARFAGGAVVLGLLGLAVTFLVLWWLPADDFILVPDPAKPLADKVEVEGGRPAAGEVYYVDVLVRRIRRLEQILPFTRPDGSSIVPEHALQPEGTSDAERDRVNAEEMARSERIAAVVALRALGHDVQATPRGALVVSVAPDVPAAGEIQAGDVIVGVDGARVRTPDELRRAVGRRAPGDDVRLAVQRGDRELAVTVATVQSPDDPGRPIIGIQVDQEADILLPIEVDIDLGRVGGPSAGLPFALEIMRKLGRDVTQGCRIAATGELALDGSVLSIGGIEQKTLGARQADVDYFLVPAGPNAAGAQEHAGGLSILPVNSFQQALRELTTSDLKC